jgi:starvation-inducible outer membrane lipoprotein
MTFQMLVRIRNNLREIFLRAGRSPGTKARREKPGRVLQKPWTEQPKDTDESFGRFLIRFESFEAPAIYTPERKITVSGEVLGKKVQPLKDMDYAYPVLTPGSSPVEAGKRRRSYVPFRHRGGGRSMKRVRILLFFLAAAFIFSCAPLSKEVMRQVDETLTFQTVQKNPQDFLGKTVLWGGVIVKTTNRQEETV